LKSLSPNELIYFVSGMWCSTCAKNVRESIINLDGVDSAQINYSSKLLFVKAKAGIGNISVLDDSIQKKVSRIGFGIKRQSGDWILRFHEALAKETDQKITWVEVSLVWFLAMWSSMFAFSGYLGGLNTQELYLVTLASAAFGLPAILIGVRSYANAGLRALWFSHLLTLDLFILLGAVAVIAVTITSILAGATNSYADSGSMILAILLLTKKIENTVTTKITTNILFQLHPTMNNTLMFKEGDWRKVDVSQIRRGDRIQIMEGETIPLDGILEDECASLNNHLINGENSRVLLKSGDDVFAGAIAHASMVLRVSAPLGQRKIDAWAEKALVTHGNAGHFEKLFQRIESKLVTIAFSGAILIALAAGLRAESAWKVSESFFVGILVFCPCLFASILPLTKQIAYLSLLKKGILTSRVEALLDLNNVRHFYFDKTGTLEAVESTYISFGGDNTVLPYLSALSANAQHVILRGLKDLNSEAEALIELAKIEEHANQGVIAWDQHGIKVVVGRKAFLVKEGIPIDEKLDPAISYVGLNGNLVGQLLNKTHYDCNSTLFLKSLLGLVAGSQIEILSGDPSASAGAAYSSMGPRIQYRGNLSPEDKFNFIKPDSAFIGDGLNDTLALAKAQVSFRLGQRVRGFAPVDFYLQTPDLNLVILAVQYAKKYRKVLIQTGCFAVFYNISTLSLAALGKFNPLGAAVAMLLSFTLMLLSVLRLQRPEGVHK
jgi:cation transport ATPase